MSDFQRKFKGVWIPADVWLDRSMSITEKVMLVEIDSLQHPERGCYASNAHFAQFFGLSSSRVSEIITSLSTKGLVTVELIREGKRVVERRVRVNQVFEKPNTYSENTANPIRETEEGYSEKAEGSNTKSSNTKSEEHGADAPAEPPRRKRKMQACPTQEIVDLFNSILDDLPQVVLVNKTRKAAISARWEESAVHQDLGFWREYFESVRSSDFLMGRAQGRMGAKPFRATFDWLIAPSNFVKVVEGNYHA